MPPATTSANVVAAWDKTAWRGEPAWTSVHDGVRAIVSESRSRVIYLGAEDGSLNLLNAPWPQVLPTAERPWPNQGGHRFWLGPQHRWVWPPPSEWEYCAARSAAVQKGVLTLVHEQVDTRYPALVRHYAWEGPRLRCTVCWPDDGGRYFGLHVVAVDAPVAVPVRLEPRPDVPAGVVAARMVEPEPPVQLPHAALATDGERAVIHSGRQKVKFGFTPQTLAIARPGGWTLAVHPGPCTEVDGAPPDHGYLSQVWVGDGNVDLAELEQLTPPLKGDASGFCSSTIFIEAAPPAR